MVLFITVNLAVFWIPPPRVDAAVLLLTVLLIRVNGASAADAADEITSPVIYDRDAGHYCCTFAGIRTDAIAGCVAAERATTYGQRAVVVEGAHPQPVVSCVVGLCCC